MKCKECGQDVKEEWEVLSGYGVWMGMEPPSIEEAAAMAQIIGGTGSYDDKYKYKYYLENQPDETWLWRKKR